MELYDFWRWVHIMLFVLWLGADVGVFICGSWIKRRTLSYEQRVVLLQASSVIDLWPRFSAALMLPVGLTLAQTWVPAVTGWWLLGAWVVAGIWLLLTVLGMRAFGTPQGERLQRITSVGLVLLALACFVYGAGWLLMPESGLGWLGIKLMLYGAVCLLAIGIELAFRPVVTGFAVLAEPARAAEANALLEQGMNRTLMVVATLYVVLIVASILGVFKPF